MATDFKWQLALSHTSPQTRTALWQEQKNKLKKMQRSQLTHCLRAWFLLLKYRISFFLIAWFLGDGKKEQEGWQEQEETKGVDIRTKWILLGLQAIIATKPRCRQNNALLLLLLLLLFCLHKYYGATKSSAASAAYTMVVLQIPAVTL